MGLERKNRIQKINRQYYELTLLEKIKNPPGNAAAGYSVGRPVGPTGQAYANFATREYAQGQDEARRFYTSYKGASTGTFITALLAGPILGLIPAAACSSTAPGQDRLGIPQNQLTQNPSYYTGYSQAAHRIKSKKVWTNYGIGAGLNILAILVLSAR